MILVTGGTGFIGKSLIRNLAIQGHSVRILIPPSTRSPDISRGIPVDAAVSSIHNEKSLSAAMKDVHTIFHLIGSERVGSKADIMHTDIDGTRTLTKVAAKSGIKHFIYLSHIGAGQASAYPLLKAKAMAEVSIKNCGIPYTIIRSGLVFGPQDQFTTSIARLIKISPFVLLLPEKGASIIHPIWIEDLITCLILTMEDQQFSNITLPIGGAEYLSFRNVVELIMLKIKKKRTLINLSPAILRILALWIEQIYPDIPVSTFWLDYLASDRTAPLDTLPRLFGLLPARIHEHLDHLEKGNA